MTLSHQWLKAWPLWQSLVQGNSQISSWHVKVLHFPAPMKSSEATLVASAKKTKPVSHSWVKALRAEVQPAILFFTQDRNDQQYWRSWLL